MGISIEMVREIAMILSMHNMNPCVMTSGVRCFYVKGHAKCLHAPYVECGIIIMNSVNMNRNNGEYYIA